jgi:uncharacterized protein (UPF0332 family)
MIQARERAKAAREILAAGHLEVAVSVVSTGAFDEKLHALATSAQRTRERGDYEAITPDLAEAEKVVEGASDFVDAVEQMLEV